MVLKGKPASLACLAALVLASFWILHNRTSQPISRNLRHIITINKLLYNLRKECISAQIAVAQNTVADVREEWSQLDTRLFKYTLYSPDSLKTLDSLLALMLDKDKSKLLLPDILKEINTINKRLDRIN